MQFITAHSAEHHACHVDPVDKTVDPQRLSHASLVHLLVRGMDGPTCAMRVRNVLLRVDGVLAVDVFLEQGMATVRYDPAQVKPSALPDALATADESGHHRYTARVLAYQS